MTCSPPFHPGDVFLLRAASTQVCVVVVGSTGYYATVLPVFDRELADEWCVLVPTTLNSRTARVAVGCAHNATLPSELFDSPIGHVDDMAEVVALRTAYRRGEPHGLPVGAKVTRADDPRVAAQHGVLDALYDLVR